MHPNLARCLDALTASTRGLANERAKVRVGGRWSIAEIVEHLQRAYSGTAKGFERCVQAGAPIVTPLSPRQRARIFVVVTLGYFPSGREAPKHVIPSGQVDLDAALAAARQSLERLDTAAEAARQRFGEARVLDHPLLGAFSVDQWQRFHWVHTRHHDRQIRNRRLAIENSV